MKNMLNTNAPKNRFRYVCVYLREPVCGDINIVYILILKKLVKMQIKKIEELDKGKISAFIFLEVCSRIKTLPFCFCLLISVFVLN